MSRLLKGDGGQMFAGDEGRKKTTRTSGWVPQDCPSGKGGIDPKSLQLSNRCEAGPSYLLEKTDAPASASTELSKKARKGGKGREWGGCSAKGETRLRKKTRNGRQKQGFRLDHRWTQADEKQNAHKTSRQMGKSNEPGLKAGECSRSRGQAIQQKETKSADRHLHHQLGVAVRGQNTLHLGGTASTAWTR